MSSIKYHSISTHLLPWPTMHYAFFSAARDREGIDQKLVRFESERVTWLPQNDFHLVFSRPIGSRFGAHFRRVFPVTRYIRYKPLLFHFPRLRFLKLLSKHSLAKVSSLVSFTSRVERRKKNLAKRDPYRFILLAWLNREKIRFACYE